MLCLNQGPPLKGTKGAFTLLVITRRLASDDAHAYASVHVHLGNRLYKTHPNWSVAQRRRADVIWIARLGSLQPVGLNVGVGRGSQGLV